MKSEFWILLTGVGQGCDHTIGCNKTWTEIICEPDQLRDQVKNLVMQYHSDFEQKIEKVEVLVVENYINYTDIIGEINSDRMNRKKLEKEAEEKKTLAKLLAKYGRGSSSDLKKDF